MSWSPVGNPGNLADTVPNAVHGAVGYAYNIGTYDVTNSQYVEFLNTKDAGGANALGLYNSNISNATYGGINFNNSNLAGNKYSVISGNGDHPVNYVTFYDAIRFANWLNNGQGNDDTETGAYTLLGGTPTPSNGNSITRNVGATVFLPSEDEWFKAGYYNPATDKYFFNPTGGLPTPTHPPGSSPSANYENAMGNLTDVGAYTGTTSPYGAFDMGGNVWQWNETLISGPSVDREARGSAFDNDLNHLTPTYGIGFDPTGMFNDVGFRLANIPTGYVPEPSTRVLAALGFSALIAWRWRRRKMLDRADSV